MAKWKGIVGRSFSIAEFDTYCRQLQWTNWRPEFIVLHNTAVPSLAQRPNGYTLQNLKNGEAYYRDKKKWSAGPHLFVDDHQIWVFTPLTTSGVHSPSWNNVSLGVEMLGDYNKDDFDTGRGLEVQKRAIAAIATLSDVLGISPSTMRLHKEDKRTTHDCPGRKVDKARFIAAVTGLIAIRVVTGVIRSFEFEAREF